MPRKLPSKQRLNLFSFSLKTLSAAMMSALLISNAVAAGLGKLTVLSALGQPLNAEIELSPLSKEEAAALVPKLAPPEAFRQANIEMHPALLGLRFAIEQRGARQVIRVTSAQAMNEPFVDMLLEVGVPNGRLVREYTFLLDPPDVRATQAPQVAAAQPVPAAPTEARLSATPAPVVQYKPSVIAANAAAAAVTKEVKEREVHRGETLSQIARENKPEGISLDQMLVALYRSNPDAFIGKNMNRLRTGTILALPDASVAAGASTGEAHHIVMAQAADFNEYRNQLAGQVAKSEAKPASDAKNTASGKITAKVAEAAAPADEAKDKLKLSKSVAAGADKASGPSESAEDKIARDKAQDESAARVKELERIVSDLQKVAEMKNKDLAERQKQSDAAQAKPVEEAPKASASVAATAATTASSKPAVVAAPPAVTPSANLLDNPLVLPGVGILLTLLGSLGFMAARRKRQTQQNEEQGFNEPGLESNSIFDAPGGQRVDTDNSVFNSGFLPTGDQTVTNEVDPVAEADVYIAYGRDAQAEEILKEALRINPLRYLVRVKLLEIYANRKDVATFAALAGEMHGMTGGKGELWAQVVLLGLGIDPDNPLYAGSTSPVVDAALPESVAMAAVDDVNADEDKALDLPAAQPDAVVQEAAPAVPVAPAGKSILASNIDDINFDFLEDDKDKPAPAAAKSNAVMSPAELESEFALLEAALAMSGDVSAGATPAPVPLDFDLTDITLDLSPQDKDAVKPEADATVVQAMDGLGEFELDISETGGNADHAEMVTKLDLAAAYEEIGDKEGARELLEEVVAGGTPEQIAKAKALLQRLA